jgi:hypothetical protein
VVGHQGLPLRWLDRFIVSQDVRVSAESETSAKLEGPTVLDLWPLVFAWEDLGRIWAATDVSPLGRR